ncbi:epoxyqueuosine reductase QueH [Candidatus Albibeggiatoa sp. nov. NOAA]|uniref:epoxyqueuosine reductase QueH n=1 Tax=Candidatus Albibeggiatoa sp. nov. NOAA TaxID=3162724 RepID=UPI003302CA93|nr:epoxyqueuosine reductase QueH [Thiotrichaceae bacterium]
MSERPILKSPIGNDEPVLLHSCCAPCTGEIMQAMKDSSIPFSVIFYNPNIHPEKEYEKRKQENKVYADRLGVEFVDLDYDPDNWFARAKHLAAEPERGDRCTVCFDMRLERSALYAHEHGFKVFTSSLGVSRWKNMQQVNGCGLNAAKHYDDLIYWDYNWRKKGGSQRMVEITKQEDFYRQEYCGCVYSLRDTNIHRKERGLEPIQVEK